MNLECESLGFIPAPATVLHLSVDPLGAVWAAAPTGLFCGRAGEWAAVSGNFPFTQVACVLSLGKVVLAAGLSGGLLLSRRAGESWQHCFLEQVAAPIACLAASPNFERDQALLAGTGGDGILRSVNGGQSWQLVNFGLRDFQIFSLATANTWEQKEPVFAGSAHGVYYSPNGGRAWRASGLEQAVVLCLGLHPDFLHNPVVLAGTEDQGLWRSADGGVQWTQVDLPGEQTLTCNALYTQADAWLLATSEAGILISHDQGISWSASGLSATPVLSLAGNGDNLYAAAYQQGVFRSDDAGKTWNKLDKWVAQRFSQWLPWTVQNQTYWVARGVQSGVWVGEDPASAGKAEAGQVHADHTDSDNTYAGQSHGDYTDAGQTHADYTDAGQSHGDHPDGGQTHADYTDAGQSHGDRTDAGRSHADHADADRAESGQSFVRPRSNWQASAWRALSIAEPSTPWYAMQICQGRLLLAGEAGVCVLPSLQEKGMIRLRSEQALISLAVMDGQAFAGSQAGQLWQSRDGGTTWMPVELPRQGLPVLALASLRQSRGFLLAAALLNERAEQIEIWRTRYDALGERLAEWDCWLSEKSIFRSVVMCLAGESGEESWFGIGDALLFRQAGQWRRKQLATHSAPVAALTKIPGRPNLLAAAGSALFCGGAQGDWVKAPGLPLAFVDFGLTGSAGQADAVAGLSLTSSARQDEDLIGLTSTGEIYRLLIEK